MRDINIQSCLTQSGYTYFGLIFVRIIIHDVISESNAYNVILG